MSQKRINILSLVITKVEITLTKQKLHKSEALAQNLVVARYLGSSFFFRALNRLLSSLFPRVLYLTITRQGCGLSFFRAAAVGTIKNSSACRAWNVDIAG